MSNDNVFSIKHKLRKKAQTSSDPPELPEKLGPDWGNKPPVYDVKDSSLEEFSIVLHQLKKD